MQPTFHHTTTPLAYVAIANRPKVAEIIIILTEAKSLIGYIAW